MAIRCIGCMKEKESRPICEHCGYDERTPAKSHHLQPGTVLGNQYTLGRVLGQGGFGITYVAWDNIMNQRVAVKEYFPGGYAGRDTRTTMEVTSYDDQNAHSFEENKKRFLREAESLAKLWNIPQIVRVLRYFEENGTAYIAMEYAEGQDLRSYMKSFGRPMTIEELRVILGPVMKALSDIHKAELVHRDISPDNIMVLSDGSSKLLDFGAARYVENANAEQDRNTSTQAILKHGFAPPEQYRSRGALGPWTDIYAMCATVYYCLSGKVPPESMSRMMGEAKLNLDNLQNLTQTQKNALEKGMALIPKERIKTAEELYQGLFGDVLLSSESTTQGTAEKSLPTEKKPGKEQSPLVQAAAERDTKTERERKQTKEKHSPEQGKATAESSPSSKGNRLWIGLAAAAVFLIVLLGINLISRQKSGAEIRIPENTQAESQQDSMSYSEEVETNVPVGTEAVVPLEIQKNMNLYPAEVGSSYVIEIPSGYAARDLQWNSSDPEVATVSEDGSVTVTGYGVTEITVQYRDQTASCKVIANPAGNLDCTYEFCAGGVMITGYNGTVSADVILPAQINGKSVKSIDDYVFENNTQITSVYIPYGVETIGWDAFGTCTKLAHVDIPESVTDICPDAFRSTPWFFNYPGDFLICGDSILLGYKGTETDIAIPENVKTVGDAFHRSATVRNVVIPETVTRVATYAFRRCPSLVSVSIAGSVREIGSSAFEDCTNLKNVTIAEGVVTIGNRAFTGCTALKEILLPSTIREIVNSAFSGCSGLMSIVIPKGVAEIDAYVFRYCNKLSSVTVPQSVTSVGYEAFSGCYSLREIALPTGCRVDANSFPANCTIRYY